MTERRTGKDRRAGMVDVEISGTHKTLTEQQLQIEAAKHEARLIMDTYAPSTIAYQAAKRALEALEEK